MGAYTMFTELWEWYKLTEVVPTPVQWYSTWSTSPQYKAVASTLLCYREQSI